MRTIIGGLLVLLIGFTSCEGRKSHSQSLAESIAEFKNNVSLEIGVYVPETFLEREVDTLLSNGYRVKIKTFTDIENNVLFTKIKDTINYQTFYRNYKFEIKVFKHGKLIYNEMFNKQKVNQLFKYYDGLNSSSLLSNFDKLAVLKSIQVNDNPLLINRVQIDVLYAIPESDRYASHALFIDEKGKFNVVQVDLK